VSPRVADAIRKACAYGLAVGLTLLLFRVLGRVAGGRQRLDDVELAATLALAALAVLWVRAARRVRRGPPPEGETGQ
jgi:hypothetical protein